MPHTLGDEETDRYRTLSQIVDQSFRSALSPINQQQRKRLDEIWSKPVLQFGGRALRALEVGEEGLAEKIRQWLKIYRQAAKEYDAQQILFSDPALEQFRRNIEALVEQSISGIKGEIECRANAAGHPDFALPNRRRYQAIEARSKELWIHKLETMRLENELALERKQEPLADPSARSTNADHIPPDDIADAARRDSSSLVTSPGASPSEDSGGQPPRDWRPGLELGDEPAMEFREVEVSPLNPIASVGQPSPSASLDSVADLEDVVDVAQHAEASSKGEKPAGEGIVPHREPKPSQVSTLQTDVLRKILDAKKEHGLSERSIAKKALRDKSNILRMKKGIPIANQEILHELSQAVDVLIRKGSPSE
jgi:hypothetical protein